MGNCAVGRNSSVIAVVALLVSACGGGGGDGGSGGSGSISATVFSTSLGLQAQVANGEGAAATFTTDPSGNIDLANPFFRALGNGRSCASCHDQNAGWSVTPETLTTRFNSTNGLDPVFRTVDGANSPNAPVATVAQRRSAYSLLLNKGLIRVGLPMPAGAEFTLDAVDDPYGFASAAQMSLFRRPLPSTNLKFSVVTMWDGRETAADTNPGSQFCVRGSNPLRCYGPVDANLLSQANNAVIGHAEAAAGLSATDQRAIVDFETKLFTAQVTDSTAGSLTEGGALGGPVNLSLNDFYFGINDFSVGDYRSSAPFNATVMTNFSAWLPVGAPAADAVTAARQSIARGERVFNTRAFTISGVAGFNDDIGRTVVQGTCSSCHSTPNSGTHSVPRLMDTGVSTAARRTADLPLYTFRNLSTGAVVQTTDPGVALLTGKWADMSKMKVPSLRGLESRSPYFHDGSENDITQLVRFYDRRFNIGFTAREIADLAAFLKAL